MKYLLPCSCGKTVLIEISQAGQTVACSCGKQLDVPALRAIRQLEPARGTNAVRTKRSRWSVPQRVIFSIGLAVAAVGFTVSTYYQWGRSRLDTKEVAWDTRLDVDLQMLESMNLEQAWENWKGVRDAGIGPYNPPAYIQLRYLSDYWKRYVRTGFGVGIVGMVIMGIAFLIPRQKVAPPRQSAPARKR